jgi:hypothetical protein
MMKTPFVNPENPGKAPLPAVEHLEAALSKNSRPDPGLDMLCNTK